MQVDPSIVRNVLLPLIGLPLFDSNCAAGMQSFSFGKEHDLPFRFPRPGKPLSRKVGEYALHVQCTWRIVGPTRIDVGSGDLAPLKQWLTTARKVIDVNADDHGGLTITLTDGYSLEVIADHTRDAELWRFFRAIDESPHFVMTGQGIEA